MATWAEMIDEIYERTKRPDLVIETAQHLKMATRIAHKSGKFWRDLQKVVISALPLDQVQEITLESVAPRLRAISSLTSTANERVEYDPIAADDLLDVDGYLRTNVYWGFGATLQVRAAAPESSLTLRYFQYPIVATPSTYNSWIANEHSDLLVNLAASNLLASVGEQEIAGRVSAMAALQLQDLKEDNIEIVGR
jgi:hypothetical protein